MSTPFFVNLALFKRAVLPFSLRPPPIRSFSSAKPRFREMHDWSTSVLTPLSYDTEPTILIESNNAKYMFNAGENTSRSFFQSHKNWKRMKGVFLTQVNTQRASGLPGGLMSFADGGIEKLSIVGPPGLNHYLATMRMCLHRKQMSLSTVECLPNQDATHPEIFFKDENVTVYSFPISPLVPFPNYESSIAEEPEAGQKRKRTNDADGPRKAPKLEGSRTMAPEDLRVATLEYMFKPARKSPPQPSEGPAVEEPTAFDEYQRAPPQWFYRQLPSFSFPSAYPQFSTLAYVVVGPRYRGHINADKLKDLEVPFNNLRGKLARGETIQFEVKGPDGPQMRTVRPEEVMGKGDPPAAVIILDVPSVEMIPSVVRSFDTVYKPFRSSDPSDLEKHTVRVVYHLLGPGVLEDERYINLINGFSKLTQHIISSPEHCPNPVTFTSHGFNQYRLSKLDPEAFPLPKFQLTASRPLIDVPSLSPTNSHVLAANTTVSLRPPGPLGRDKIAHEDRFHPAVLESQSLPESTAAAFQTAKDAVSRHPVEQGLPLSGVKILPLGTGSAIPSKYRNVSSTLVRTPSGNILLDAGEGVTGQLKRCFGVGCDEDFNQVLANLKCIFVSHIHADHHLGLAKLLRQRRLLPHPLKYPLYVISIRNIHLGLKEYHELEDIGLCDDPSQNGVVQIMSDALNYKWSEYPQTGMWRVGGDELWLDINLSRNNSNDMCRSLGLTSFKTVDVYHRTKAYGAFFVHRDGWSIAFSGDTMPTPNLARAAQNATLVIHEATMGDDQEELAKQKAHSTIGQAIQVARDMNAKNILLTHFSARYPKMPRSVLASPEEKDSECKGPLVTLAFDLAELDLDKMWKMNLYLPAIEQCFEDSAEEGDADIHASIPEAITG